jgi:hypothetical protein
MSSQELTVNEHGEPRAYADAAEAFLRKDEIAAGMPLSVMGTLFSNRIYQAVGYVRAGESAHVTWAHDVNDTRI